jgi:phosphoglycerate dehydrogenase-like enzyme
MSILIATPDAEYYRDCLRSAVPEGVFYAATTSDDALCLMGEVRGVIAFASGVSASLLAKAHRLERVQALSSGTDKLVEFVAHRPEVAVTSCHGVQGPAVAEMAFMHMLALARDLPRLVENQRQAVWARYAQPLLYGKTAVIVGTGIIATELAKRCQAFGMTTVGISASPRTLEAFNAVHSRQDLPAIAVQADFLIVLVPLSSDTVGLINANVLAAMKSTAILVNLARGGVCDETAVLEAVRQRQIAAVGLDVFELEPLPRNHPLWRTDRVLITPHMGGESDNYADQVMPILIENSRRFFEGRFEEMKNLVRPRQL